MSLLLCHDCYCWIEPRKGHCPECLEMVSPSAPDPSLSELQEAMGELTSRIGEVKVPRKVLPDRGTLFGTTNGLFFLPYAVEYQAQEKPKVSGSSVLWSLAAVLWSPLVLILPFVKAVELEPKKVQVYRPRQLTPGESHLMPELLMENPGVFFIPRKTVHMISRKRNGWLIERTQGAALKIKPDQDADRFHRRMEEVISSGTWQHVIVE